MVKGFFTYQFLTCSWSTVQGMGCFKLQQLGYLQPPSGNLTLANKGRL